MKETGHDGALKSTGYLLRDPFQSPKPIFATLNKDLFRAFCKVSHSGVCYPGNSCPEEKGVSHVSGWATRRAGHRRRLGAPTSDMVGYFCRVRPYYLLFWFTMIGESTPKRAARLFRPTGMLHGWPAFHICTSWKQPRHSRIEGIHNGCRMSALVRRELADMRNTAPPTVVAISCDQIAGYEPCRQARTTRETCLLTLAAASGISPL